ncbi:MAG: hypothetical protein Q8928_04665 [Bacteroidota bacterium]|nr:hypothetical protein [Bacteroidota bacterium]
MTITELHKKLIAAYSVDNLNKISLTLINLYKNQQYSILRKIAKIINDVVNIEIQDDGKGFSKLMMLYHPDRTNHHILEINKLAAQNNFDGLLEYAHILQLERLDEITSSLDSLEDIDYSPVYEWDFKTEGFRTFYDSEVPDDIPINQKGYSFYDAIKLREYGRVNIEYPSYYLEDIEEFELSSSHIIDLDGLQFCIHAKTIDLSDNLIFDLSYLEGLSQLEDLNLSDNKIGYIDSLSYLINLKRVDLSNNNVNDITPLYELEYLEYVNLTGTLVPMSQIDKLTDLGVTVDY